MLRILLTAWASTVAAVTLSIGDTAALPVTEQLVCLACGTRGTADMILNWLLFVPLGLGLGWLRNARAAVRVSFLVTAAIEGIQLFLPGRHPALQDIVANTIGGASGAWLAAHGTRVLVSRALSVAAIGAWVAPTVLLLPARTEAPYYGQWTPDRGELQMYRGQVLSASIGNVPVPSTLVDHGQELEDALARRGPLTLRLVVGDRTTSFSPIFSVYDSRGRGVMHVAALGDDLIVQRRSVASALRLDQPDVRWVGALASFSAGDTLTIRDDPLRSSHCIGLDTETRCGLAAGSGNGWTLLLNPMGAPAAVRAATTISWCLGIGATLGLAVGALGPAAAAGLVLAAAGLLAGILTPDMRPSLAHAVLLMIGCLLGAAIRSPVTRIVDFLRGDPAQSRAMPQ